MKSWLHNFSSWLPFKRKKVATASLADPSENALEQQPLWWGTFIIEEDQSRYFKVGNLVLCVDRFEGKWHVTTYHEGEKPFKTFAARTSNEISLKPTLPDRAVLSRLERSFYIPVGETLMLYMSSPLWIRIEAGHPAILLEEIATEALADTWFGKNTLEGELCYADTTTCSPSLDDLPRDSTHVITPISIENRSKETLLLHELKVPLPLLSIYSDNQNCLWTEQLNIFQTDAESIESVVVKGPPKPLKSIQFVSPARFQSKAGLKNLIGQFMWK